MRFIRILFRWKIVDTIFTRSVGHLSYSRRLSWLFSHDYTRSLSRICALHRIANERNEKFCLSRHTCQVTHARGKRPVFLFVFFFSFSYLVSSSIESIGIPHFRFYTFPKRSNFHILIYFFFCVFFERLRFTVTRASCRLCERKCECLFIASKISAGNCHMPTYDHLIPRSPTKSHAKCQMLIR